MLDGSHYFECKCGAMEHTLRFVVDKDEKTLYADMHLTHYDSFWKRLIIGIKYIFGGKGRYGDFGSWILSTKETERLSNLLEKVKNNETNISSTNNSTP